MDARAPQSVKSEHLPIYNDVSSLRRELKMIADRVGAERATAIMTKAESEAIANLTLAFRHLEDASMRLGKVLQHLDGGVSVYDRTQVPGA